MLRYLLLVVIWAALAAGQTTTPSRPVPASDKPPRSDEPTKQEPEKGGSSSSSSSKELPVDLSPPEGDDKAHPNSAIAVREAEDAAGLYEGDELGGIDEFHPWDPHKALKDVEVGDFYFKKKNYRAALDRYQEALYYKNNDAVATFRLAVCQEKLGDVDEARKGYEAYLKILPEGPFAAEAHQAVERLKAEGSSNPPAEKKGGDR